MLPFFFSLNPIIKDPQPIVCMADVVTRQELHEIIEESKLRMKSVFDVPWVIIS